MDTLRGRPTFVVSKSVHQLKFEKMATLHSQKPRLDGEKAADFYSRLEGGHLAKTNAEHIVCMEGALKRCVASGEAEYERKDNGCGSIHVYKFKEGQAPSFATNSGDLLNQNEIIEM